ncbi:MAG: 8-hydroxy-5-deazaflavin:NADPH oxidoreductase [Actinomycetota bacterium]|nr:8-hydroxy-5-deazaflavin:NADPH oxidoreductase [Actinomycetota bacterium]
MRIGVLGTGMVGQALATRLVETGHDVMMGSRTAGNEKAVSWAAQQPERAATGTFADAARHGEVVVNATGGGVSLEVLRSVDTSDLDGKVLVDVANPMVWAGGPLPTLSPDKGDSLAEQIQREFPGARVVKALNTVNAGVMVDPAARVPAPHDLFIAGDDADAKAVVRDLLAGFGWDPALVHDVGGIASAQGLEAYLLFWIVLRTHIGNHDFNIHVAR